MELGKSLPMSSTQTTSLSSVRLFTAFRMGSVQGSLCTPLFGVTHFNLSCLPASGAGTGASLSRKNRSRPARRQDDQINYLDHLDHLDETKDLAAKMIKPVRHRSRTNQAEKRWRRKRAVTRQSNAERRQSIGDCARDGADPSNRAALARPLHPESIQRGRAAHAPTKNVRHAPRRRQQVVEKAGGNWRTRSRARTIRPG
jgi:hypothetical protein